MRGPRLGRLQAASAALLSRRLLATSSAPASARHGAPRSVAALLEWKPEHPVENVVVKGFVRSVRAMKSAHFISLSDGSSATPIQAILPADRASGCASSSQVACLGCRVC